MGDTANMADFLGGLPCPGWRQHPWNCVPGSEVSALALHISRWHILGLFILMIHDIYGDCARRSSGERTPPASVAFDSSDSPSVLAGPAAGDYPVINLERRGSVSGTRA